MDKLGLDIKQIVAQLINFILFFLIFKKFIARPFARFLDEEKAKAKETETALARIRLEEEQLAVRRNQLNEEMKTEFDKAMKEAKKEADILKKELIIEAKKEAEEIKNKGKNAATVVETARKTGPAISRAPSVAARFQDFPIS